MTVSVRKFKETRAILAGVQTAEVSDFAFESSMSELERLVKTLGFLPVGQVSQKRRTPAPGTVFGTGKLKELASWTGGPGVIQGFRKSHDLGDEDEISLEENPESIPLDESMEDHFGKQANIVIVDHELTPTQLSNLTVELQLLEARAIIEKHSLEQTGTMIYYLSAKTQLYSHRGSPEAMDRGEEVAEEALALAKILYGTQSSDYCGQLRDLAGIIFQRAQFYNDHEAAEQALAYYDEARAMYQKESSETYAYLRLLQASLEVLEFLNEQDEDLYEDLSRKAESLDVMLGLKNSAWEEDDSDNLE